MKRTTFSSVHVFLLIALLQLILTVGFMWFSYTAISNLQYLEMKLVHFGNLIDSDYTCKVQSTSFFRFTKVVGHNYVGNCSFSTPVYLIGATTTSCASAPQNYELTITYPNKLEIVGELDENGNGWYNFKHYFYLRVNTETGKVNDRFFLPSGFGYFLEAGELVHFGMWSVEIGRGGEFTLYFVEALTP